MRSPHLPLLVLAAFAGCAWAADPDGAALYKARCASCHDSDNERIPKRGELAARPPESVLAAMFAGSMLMQAAGLSLDEGRAIARYVTGKEFSTTAEPMAGQCATPGSRVALAPTDWNGWGFESGNSRYQPRPGLFAEDIPKLKLKWAFGFSHDAMAFAQPTLVGGRVFVGSGAGTVYSLDAATGCIYWAYRAGAGVRTAITIAPAATGDGYVAYFGDILSYAHAVNADTGQAIWKVRVEDHAASRITGAPTLHEGRLYVPVASIEEVSGTSPKYECCTFRGSLVALDASTGRQIWKSYSVPDPAKPYKMSKVGTQLRGPAGAAIWSSPTIDAGRKMIYVSTGDSYTDVEIGTSDAILAYSMDTGSLVWAKQVQAKDNFIVGCPNAPNCPESNGPDYDFGTSPVLRSIGGGRQILVVAQKSGIVYGLDPDAKGNIVWQTRVGAGSALGGVEWGHAADDQYVYAAVSDSIVRSGGKPGLYALRLDTGAEAWSVPAPKVPCSYQGPCSPAQSAAISVIPGAVFSGAMNGHFRAYSAKTGEILWDFDTGRSFETVNHVAAKGASINGPGPTIANGMVLTNSGYGILGGAPGNVLLAFSVDGK